MQCLQGVVRVAEGPSTVVQSLWSVHHVCGVSGDDRCAGIDLAVDGTFSYDRYSDLAMNGTFCSDRYGGPTDEQMPIDIVSVHCGVCVGPVGPVWQKAVSRQRSARCYQAHKAKLLPLHRFRSLMGSGFFRGVWPTAKIHSWNVHVTVFRCHPTAHHSTPWLLQCSTELLSRLQLV